MVTGFIFLGSKLSVDGDWSHEIKRHLLLGMKAMTNLDSILINRDTTLLTKIHRVKAIFFPIVLCGCESWTIKKAEHRRFDSFKILKVPWTARRLNQSILKEISPEYSLEGLMLKLKHQYFGSSSSVKSWLTGKDPDAGKDWGQDKGRTEDKMVGWHHRLNGHEFEQTLSEGQGSLACCSP